MAELENVILGIENCITTDSVTECRKTECPFIACRESCLEWLLRSALSLLKAQEPRVMTYDEMMKAEVCFLEVKGIEEIYPFIRYEVGDKSYWSSPYMRQFV